MKLTDMSLLICASLSLSAPALAFLAKNKMTEDGYRIEIFECDKDFEELSTENRQRKIQGSSYRICFRPNEKALEDGVGIERIDHFTWELLHKQGVAEQPAVINGDGDNILTILNCNEDGKLCYLDSMLIVDFYADAGSVLGYGEAFFTGNKGKVEMERYLFPHDFKFTMLNPDGTKMSDEELANFKSRMEAQEADILGNKPDTIDEASVLDPTNTKEEL